MMDHRKLKRIRVEIERWEERRRRALELRDRKMYERVMRERRRIERLKNEMEMERLKSMAASFVLWFTVFKLLWDAVGEMPVGLVPLPGGYVAVPFYAWYMMHSLWAGILMERVGGALKQALSLRKAS